MIQGRRRRLALQIAAGAGALVGYVSFMALIGGLIHWDRDLASPLLVEIRGWETWFEHAWHYLLPVALVVVVSAGVSLASLIWIVTHPLPRVETRPR